jgi:integrase
MKSWAYARNCRTRVDWATVKGYRESVNPARWKGHLEHLMKSRKELAAAGHAASKVRHHPALPYARIKEFLAELRCIPGAGARALEFAILTAARSGEVRGALWSEIDLGKCTWSIPAGRMKAARDHDVPLSAAAVNLLRRLDRREGQELVFVGERGSKRSARGTQPISDMTITAVVRRMNASDAGVRWFDPRAGKVPVVPHGFRSTFRDWAAEETEFPNELVEMALAHAVGNKVEAAYRRGNLFERRRKLMDAWGIFCCPEPEL